MESPYLTDALTDRFKWSPIWGMEEWIADTRSQTGSRVKYEDKKKIVVLSNLRKVNFCKRKRWEDNEECGKAIVIKMRQVILLRGVGIIAAAQLICGNCEWSHWERAGVNYQVWKHLNRLSTCSRGTIKWWLEFLFCLFVCLSIIIIIHFYKSRLSVADFFFLCVCETNHVTAFSTELADYRFPLFSLLVFATAQHSLWL